MSDSGEQRNGGSPASVDRPNWPVMKPIFIGAASIIISVAVLYIVFVLARPLAILLASIIIAAALDPIVRSLERWMPRALAAVVTYAAIVIIAIAIVTTIGVTIVLELRNAVDQIPSDREELVGLIAEYAPVSEERANGLVPEQGPNVAELPVRIPIQVVSALFEIIVAFFLSIYWLIAAPRIHRFFLSMVPDGGKRSNAAEILRDISQKMGGYVRGIALDGVILGIATYIGLILIDVRFAIVLALLSGLSVLVPIIGPVAAAIPAILLAFVDSPLKALLVLVLYIGLQQIESNVILPNIMRRQAQIDPLLAVFAVFAGATIGNILGAIIAVPTAGAIQIVVTKVIAPTIRDRLDVDPDSAEAMAEAGED